MKPIIDMMINIDYSDDREIEEEEMSSKYITGRVYQFDVNDIVVRDGFNSRNFDTEAMIQRVEELATSIEKEGVREPIKVEIIDDKPYLINGETRYRACLLLQEKGIDVKIPGRVQRYSSDKERLIDQALSNRFQDLTPLEWGYHYQRLIDAGMTKKEIAESLGISQPTISNRLQLLKPENKEVAQLVEQGEIAADKALSVMREAKRNGEDPIEAVKEEVEKPVEEKVKKPSLKALVKEMMTDSGAKHVDGVVHCEIDKDLWIALYETAFKRDYEG